MKPFLWQRGLTVVEMMITVAILAIGLGIAVPSYRELTVQHRLSVSANEFLSALHLARSEAVRRAQQVVVCRSSDGESCATTADGWESGWIVFADVNGNQRRDETEELLRAWGPLPAGITLSINRAELRTAISYMPNARIAQVGATAGSFSLCASSTSRGRQIVLTNVRARVEPKDDCS